MPSIFRLRVNLPPHFLDGLQKLFQTFCGKILRLHGNQGGVCCCQCVHGQHPKGRSAVQQNKIVLVLCTFQYLLEHLFPVHAVDKGNFQPCQFNVSRNQVNALCVVQNAFTGRNALVVYGFLHQGGKGGGQFIGLLPAHANGQAALWVSIYQQNFFAFGCKSNAQIFTGGGLAGAAFLVDDGNRGCFL